MAEIIQINKNTWRIENGAELIENKKCQGNPIDMFGNKVMLYKFEYAGFLCES